jgi:hypothetical protein
MNKPLVYALIAAASLSEERRPVRLHEARQVEKKCKRRGCTNMLKANSSKKYCSGECKNIG